jgi:hypothetical protein
MPKRVQPAFARLRYPGIDGNGRNEGDAKVLRKVTSGTFVAMHECNPQGAKW